MKAGNVGIGTSTPSQILDINGTMKYDKDNADLQLDYGSITFSQVTPPSTVCTATDLGVSDGNITASNIRYKITYITNVGETNQTLESDVVAGPLVNGKIKLTNIPVSDNPVVTGRKIYRRDSTQGGPSGYYSVYVGTINDNTTTEWVDNVANPGYAIGAIKNINTAGGGMFGLTELNVGGPGELGYINIYNDNGNLLNTSGFLNFYDRADSAVPIYQMSLDSTDRFMLSSKKGTDCTLYLNGLGNTPTSIAFVGAGSRGSYTAKGDYNHYIAPNAGYGAGHLIFQSTGGTGNFKLLADNSKAMFGAASDASIYYDGADMIFDSREVGSGDFIFNNGNVGIGTVSPSDKLDVSGKIALDGTTIAYRPTTMTGTLILGDGGTNLLHTTGSEGYYNTFVGLGAGSANTTGIQNTANGNQSLYSNTTGNYNTANGMYSLFSNTTGSYNTANGNQSLRSNTTGNYNTANGYQSLRSNTTGIQNTANGMYSLFSNTTGNYNTANGMCSLFFNTTGNNNTANGYQAGRYITDGSTPNKTGSNNVFLGYNTRALADGDTNEIVIGYNATGSGTNTATIGNSNVTDLYLKNDNYKLRLGAAGDASIYYDGTDLNINPKEVGSGYLSVLGAINAGANDIYTTGAVKGIHKAADGTAAVADGTYTVGIGTTTNGTITIKDGIITAIQEAT